MKQIRERSALVFALFLGVVGPAQAADQAMIDAAKKDGSLTWYTSQIIDQFARPAAEAFEKKYGIRVDYLRADSTELALRIVNEAKAGKVQADIFDGTSPTPALKREGLVEQWIPPSAEALPSQYRDRDRYWAATNLYVLTPGFNTELVPKGTEPKTYQDLLDPKWKGKMAWNSAPQTSAAPGFIGTVLADMGEDKGMDYLRALAKQNVTSVKVSARQVLDQVIAGEYSIALQIFNNHAIISAAQGAPSAWIAMNPSLAVLSAVSLTKGGPHPAAARLFFDFLVSEDGQKLYRAADYMPVDPNVPPRDPSLRPDGVKFRAITLTPEQIDASMPKWVGIYNDLFR
ncbi:MAG TPA: extracellular solute-binding protein [Beijerinckiaceae bacterium]|nr:extracellular solute-binding protein [Beijerinckiaceae bacterium]